MHLGVRFCHTNHRFDMSYCDWNATSCLRRKVKCMSEQVLITNDRSEKLSATLSVLNNRDLLIHVGHENLSRLTVHVQ